MNLIQTTIWLIIILFLINITKSFSMSPNQIPISKNEFPFDSTFSQTNCEETIFDMLLDLFSLEDFQIESSITFYFFHLNLQVSLKVFINATKNNSLDYEFHPRLNEILEMKFDFAKNLFVFINDINKIVDFKKTIMTNFPSLTKMMSVRQFLKKFFTFVDYIISKFDEFLNEQKNYKKSNQTCFNQKSKKFYEKRKKFTKIKKSFKIPFIKGSLTTYINLSKLNKLMKYLIEKAWNLLNDDLKDLIHNYFNHTKNVIQSAKDISKETMLEISKKSQEFIEKTKEFVNNVYWNKTFW